jgi:hypothetical protein
VAISVALGNTVARDFSSYDDVQLETLALGEGVTPPEQGAARAELERRRRDYETRRDEQRWVRDGKLAELNGRYRANQMDHETWLASKQIAHAEKLASEQSAAARDSAKATKAAAWAAGLSAIAAIVSAGAAVFATLHR